ncbi:MAG: TetR/AcrR family transcriptional regulator [Bacteroidales bacterium]|nr:TetR/AcrR family transcriptional regulator [Candidatus Cacconaster equi]
MYRIKDDKRVVKSAAMIRDGLIKCLQNKAITEVSVSEVANASNVSRATFYRIFDAPIDVLKYICDNLATDVINEHSSIKGTDRDEFLKNTFQLWMNRSEILEAIMRSGRPDLMLQSFQELWEKYSDKMPHIIDKSEIDYINVFFSAMMCSLLYVWVSHGKKETPEQLLSIFKKISLLGK